MLHFIQPYQVNKGSDYTHTSIIKPSGSFYIPGDKLDDFYAVYGVAMSSKADLYLTEKPREIMPILIDIDFRYPKDKVVRRYTAENVKKIAEIYLKHIKTIVNTPDKFSIYVMEKPAPVVDKDRVKDGIHIVIPEVVTKPSVQLLIRQEVLKEIHEVFAGLELTNAYEDVIDEAVITRNNWQMYGSKKPGCEPYVISAIYDQDMNLLDILEDHTEYVSMLSLRNKYIECATKIEALDKVKAIDNDFLRKKKDKMMKNTSVFQTSQNIKKNTVDDIEYIGKLINILSPERANSYSLWIRLGWCLRNIDYRLLDNWIEFSKKSTKFVEGECERIWNYMKDDGLGIGSLHMWAREDDPEAYKEIMRTDINRLIDKASSETHTDIAAVVYALYKHEYVCISIKNNLWYEFRDHRWHPCDSAHTLRTHVSSTVSQEFSRRASYWAQRASTEEDESEQSRCADKGKKLLTVAMNLKKVAFKENIMKESRDMFYQMKFEEKLDSRCHLIGFENGVYDLEAHEFREGRPEDYMMFTTGINYVPFDPESKSMSEINEFLNKVFTNPNVREYITSLLASFLNGNVRQERFHLWTGSGCFAEGTQILMHNGSSKPVEEVKVGDVLMGDDSTPRNVLQLFRGYSDMYRIVPVKGDPFVVNGEHKIVVKMSNTVSLYRHWTDKQKFVVEWIEKTESSFVKMKSKPFNSKEEAKVFSEKLKKEDKVCKLGDVFKITVHDYLKLQVSIRRYMNQYRPEIVEFEKKEVSLDPYFLGYWLGDGNSYDPAFTTAETEVFDYINNHCDEIGCQIAVYAEKGIAKTYGISGKIYGDKHTQIDIQFRPRGHPATYQEEAVWTRQQLQGGDHKGPYDHAVWRGGHISEER